VRDLRLNAERTGPTSQTRCEPPPIGFDDLTAATGDHDSGDAEPDAPSQLPANRCVADLEIDASEGPVAPVWSAVHVRGQP